MLHRKTKATQSASRQAARIQAATRIGTAPVQDQTPATIKHRKPSDVNKATTPKTTYLAKPLVSCTAYSLIVLLYLIGHTGTMHYWKLLQITVAFQKHKSFQQ